MGEYSELQYDKILPFKFVLANVYDFFIFSSKFHRIRKTCFSCFEEVIKDNVKDGNCLLMRNEMDEAPILAKTHSIHVYYAVLSNSPIALTHPTHKES